METVWSSLVNRRSSWKILQLTAQLHNVYFLLQTKTTHVDSEMINITKFDIVTLCATLSEENNVFENNIYLHFVYTIEVFLKQLVTGHPVGNLVTQKCNYDSEHVKTDRTFSYESLVIDITFSTPPCTKHILTIILQNIKCILTKCCICHLIIEAMFLIPNPCDVVPEDHSLIVW